MAKASSRAFTNALKASAVAGLFLIRSGWYSFALRRKAPLIMRGSSVGSQANTFHG